ncbi:MAG: hypothetical protein RDV41_08770, partial [Planctomycetota bacterium]|nr:hypothetical protein [Planctomycetota bacterium]
MKLHLYLAPNAVCNDEQRPSRGDRSRRKQDSSEKRRPVILNLFSALRRIRRPPDKGILSAAADPPEGGKQ